MKATINYESVLKRANELYAEEKTKHIPDSTKAYWAPELFPSIASDQVKCAIRAIVEELNKQS